MIAEAISSGDREASARAVAALMGRGVDQQSIEQVVSRSVNSHINDVLSHRAAVLQLENDLPAIKTDPTLQMLAATEERRIRVLDSQRGIARSYGDVYRDVAANINAFLGRVGGARTGTPPAPAQGVPTLQARREAKAAAPAPVSGAGAARATATPTPVRSGSTIVAEMRARRAGGGQNRI